MNNNEFNNNEFNINNNENFNTENKDNKKSNKKGTLLFLSGLALGCATTSLVGITIMNNEELGLKLESNPESREYTFKRLSGDIIDVSNNKFTPDGLSTRLQEEGFIYNKALSNDRFLYMNQWGSEDGSNDIAFSIVDKEMNLITEIKISYDNEDSLLTDYLYLENGNFLTVISTFSGDGTKESVTFEEFDSKGNSINKITKEFIYTPRFFKCNDNGDFIVELYDDKAENLYYTRYNSKGEELFVYKPSVDETLTYGNSDKEDTILFLNGNKGNRVVKLDKDGKVVLDKIIYDTSLHVHDFLVTSDNGILLNVSDYNLADPYDTESYTIKLDSLGNVEWKSKHNGEIWLNSLNKEVEDGFIVFNVLDYYSEDEEGITNSIPTVIKYDKTGKEVFKKQFGIINDFNMSSFEIGRVYEENNSIVVEGSHYYGEANNIKFTIDNNGNVK